jgi:hypothetical protein
MGEGLSFFRLAMARARCRSWAFLGRQVEQHDRHLDVDQMGGDLRAHHARAEHGDFFTLNRDMSYVPLRASGAWNKARDRGAGCF